MPAPQLFDIPTIARLQTVLQNFRAGQLLIPNFQRPFVWRDEQRLQLFDSILKGLPIGSLLIWRTAKPIAVKHEIEGFTLPPAPASEQVRNYVLDGQQRLFTLFAALSGEVSEDRERRWPIYADLEAIAAPESDERSFRLRGRTIAPPPTWMPLSVTLNSRALFAFQRELTKHGHGELMDLAEEIANTIRDYPLALVPILTDDLNLVTQSFQRINSAGSQMSEAHMLRALTYEEDFDLSERFRSISSDLPGRWSELDEQPFVNVLKVLCDLSIYRADMEKLKEKLARDPEILGRAGQGIQAAAQFACNHLHTLSPAALPYIYQFVGLASAAANGADLEARAEEIKRWFWVTAYTELFTGMPAGQLRSVFTHLQALAKGDNEQTDPPGLPGTCTPLERFSTPSVRSLLLMHRLARLQGDRGDQLLTRGSEAYMRLLPRGLATDPANRFLAAPEEHVVLRQQLLDLTVENDPLRSEHMLPQSDSRWWSEWRELRRVASPRGDAARRALKPVFQWRRDELRRQEAESIAAHGLALEQPPS